MATASTTPAATAALPIRLVSGVIGGLVGGVMFGILMQMMDMIGMIAMLVKSDSIAVGWVVHLAISAGIGASFALLFSGLASSLVKSVLIGMAYGIVWWVLGGLILMPIGLGMTDMVLTIGSDQWLSLMGHAIYGLFLGGVFCVVRHRLQRR